MTITTGIDLALAYFEQVVRPILARDLPALPYAAARLGSGSDVLGFDDATSRDHDWGLRLTLLTDESAPELSQVLETSLPDTFEGHPVRFATSWHSDASHSIEVATVHGFAESCLGVSVGRELSTSDWLALPSQAVLEVVAGPVFHDTTRGLAPLRNLLRWYPPSVERIVLAAGWRRVEQQLPFVGRTAETGQELRSRILAAELADDLMRLAYLLHRAWAPYPKWREAALRRIPGTEPLLDALTTAVVATEWVTREGALADAIEWAASLQRSMGLPTPDQVVMPFWNRPYRAVNEAVIAALLDGSAETIGSVDQWVDSVDALRRDHRAGILAAYRTWSSSHHANFDHAGL